MTSYGRSFNFTHNHQEVETIAQLISHNMPTIMDYKIAQRLLTKFFSFSRIIKSPADQLLTIEGLDFHHVVQLKSVYVTHCYMKKEKLQGIPLTVRNEALHSYCLYLMSDLCHEQVHVFYLCKKDFLIEDEVFEGGYLDHCPFDKRTFFSRLLEVGASGFILAHNHPSNNLIPSQDDLALTQDLRSALKSFEIDLKGHLIVGQTECQIINC